MKKIFEFLFCKKNKINKCDSPKLEQRYLCIVENIDIDLLDSDIKNLKIETIGDNLYQYLNNAKLLLEHDYTTHLSKDIPIRVKHTKTISEWIKDSNGYIHDDVNNLFKEFIITVVDLNRIYDMIKNNKTNVDDYNSMVLKIYIINMCKIVDSITQHLK